MGRESHYRRLGWAVFRLEPPDLVLFMTMLDAAAEAVPAGTDRAAAARRLITVVFDGILT